MSNKAYYTENIVLEVESAIKLLIECNGHCSPTEVLRLLGYDETNETRTFVRDIAVLCGFVWSPSGKGIQIREMGF